MNTEWSSRIGYLVPGARIYVYVRVCECVCLFSFMGALMRIISVFDASAQPPQIRICKYISKRICEQMKRNSKYRTQNSIYHRKCLNILYGIFLFLSLSIHTLYQLPKITIIYSRICHYFIYEFISYFFHKNVCS